jgi:hypothetical protein
MALTFTKRLGAGTLVQWNTTSANYTGPWVTIPGMQGTITMPGGTPSTIDVTTHDDVAAGGRFVQNAAGLAQVPDLGGTFILDTENDIHQAIMQHVISGTTRYFRFCPPGSTTGRFLGCVGQLGFTSQADINGTVGGTLTIKAQSINFNVT